MPNSTKEEEAVIYQKARVEGSPTVTVWTARSLIEHASQCGIRTKDGRILPSRTIGWGGLGARFRAAWLVWTGQADAVRWEAADESI